MSLQDLSNALENKVTKQSLNKYESGLMKPTNEVLMALSNVLGIKPEYLLRMNQIELGETHFRKKTGLSKKKEEAIIEKARDYVERFVEIESILGLETRFVNPLRKIKISNKSDVENAASALRKAWELGSNPIPNIIEMLELKGIKIMLIDDVDQLDGFAVFSSKEIPIVVINTSNKSIERTRFTIIHELAHLLLQFDATIKEDKKIIEKLCHYFSSCFLIPSKMLISMIGNFRRSYISIKELIAIKEYYGISLRALIHRLKELGVITQNYYQRWIIYLSKTYGSFNEPGGYKGEENLKVFEQLINRALSEGIISMSKAASLCDLNVNDLRKGALSVG